MLAEIVAPADAPFYSIRARYSGAVKLAMPLFDVVQASQFLAGCQCRLLITARESYLTMSSPLMTDTWYQDRSADSACN